MCGSMLLRRITPILCVVALASSCGSTGEGAGATTAPAQLGDLPDTVVATTSVADTTDTVLGSTTTLAPEDQVGARTSGNRVIVIGDSVMASTSRRYSNDMCKALVPLGWQVEVDAETGRFIPFGNKVLDRRLSAGWDAAVILLGNNYLEDQSQYRKELLEIVERLAPRPTVLLTVTEFKPSRRKVNEVIREIAATHDNVTIVDWATTTAEDRGLTGSDRLHLTTRGRAALALNVALALGDAPEQPGACLSTQFTDDSSGPVTGTTVKGSGSTSSTVGSTEGTTGPTDPPPTDPVPTDPTTTGPAPTVSG